MLRLVDKNKGPPAVDECETLKQKFLSIVNADEKDGTATRGEVADGATLSNAAARGDPRAIRAMYDLLSSRNVDLSEEQKIDAVITHDDLHKIWACEAGEDVPLDQSTTKLEGDIAFGGNSPRESAAMLAQFKAAISSNSSWLGPLWNTNGQGGRLPFCYSSSVNDETKRSMAATIDMFRKQIPCIEFVEVGLRTENTGSGPWQGSSSWGACVETPSVIVRSDNKEGDGCYSYVGMLSVAGGNSQLLNIGRGCESIGIVAHEFGHALGMGHEHSRSDRDNYVTVHNDYIVRTAGQSWLSQVRKNSGVDTSIPYDILSLMHYGHNGGWITVKPPNQDLSTMLGQRMGLSEYDVDQFGSMYSCRDTVTPLLSNAAMIDHAKFPGCFNEDNSKKQASEFPADASNCERSDCPAGAQWHDWAKTNCRRMCDFCAGAPARAGGDTGRPAPAPATQAPVTQPPATLAPATQSPGTGAGVQEVSCGQTVNFRTTRRERQVKSVLVAPAGQSVTISTCGLANWDTQIFEGSCANDDACDAQSECTFISDSSGRNEIVLGGYGQTGQGSFKITCAREQSVSCGDTVSFETKGPSERFSAVLDASPGTSVTISTCGLTDWDTKIYSPDENDDACGTQSQLTFDAKGNDKIEVGGYGDLYGQGRFSITCQ
jgi:hypothetical protein